MHTAHNEMFDFVLLLSPHEVPVPAVIDTRCTEPTYFGIQVAKIIQAELPLELCAYEVS